MWLSIMLCRHGSVKYDLVFPIDLAEDLKTTCSTWLAQFSGNDETMGQLLEQADSGLDSAQSNLTA